MLTNVFACQGIFAHDPVFPVVEPAVRNILGRAAQLGTCLAGSC